MKTINKIAIGVATALGLGFTFASVQAQQGPMGYGMGSGMMRGGMMQSQVMGPNAPMNIMRQLMTPAERLAIMDKMAEAKTVEERQALAISTRAEMEKRAKENGITLPAGYGPQMLSGRNCG